MADWVGRVGVTLQPLVERLKYTLLQMGCLHADETPVSQLDPEAHKGKTRKAYLWAYRSLVGQWDGHLPPIGIEVPD
jgi:hypothetical protein